MKKKTILICCIVLVAAVAAAFLRITAFSTKSTEKGEKSFSAFFDEKKISYSDCNVSNGVLAVDLCSSGEGRCTQEDIKAIQAIYDAVHTPGILGEVNSVNITIRDIHGAVIFNECRNDVATPLEGETLVRAEATQMTMQEKNTVTDYARSLAAAYPVSIDAATVEQVEGRPGNKIALELSSSNGDPSFVNAIYSALAEYARTNEKITQCEIILCDADGGCAIYASGDFQYGDYIAWVSPEMEDSFVAAEGPMPINE